MFYLENDSFLTDPKKQPLIALYDKLTSALIGLARSLESHTPTEETIDILCRNLLLLNLPETAEDSLSAAIQELHAEKSIVAPNCATCANPCGSTDDYDMDKLYHASPEIYSLKCQIFDRLFVLVQAEKKEADFSTLLLRSLCYISYDLAASSYEDLLTDLS